MHHALGLIYLFLYIDADMHAYEFNVLYLITLGLYDSLLGRKQQASMYIY